MYRNKGDTEMTTSYTMFNHHGETFAIYPGDITEDRATEIESLNFTKPGGALDRKVKAKVAFIRRTIRISARLSA